MNNKIEDLKKLKLLISIVPHGKKEIITDLLENYDVNFSYSVRGKGTASEDLIEMLGLNNDYRDIIFSFIRAEKAGDAILALEDKFTKFKNHKSIAFTIPLSSVIGMQTYLFLSNLGGEYIGK